MVLYDVRKLIGAGVPVGVSWPPWQFMEVTFHRNRGW